MFCVIGVVNVVYIVFGMVRNVEIEYMGNVWNVEIMCSYVRGYEELKIVIVEFI